MRWWVRSRPTSDRSRALDPFPAGSVVVVTGAASGIGAAVVRRLAGRARVLMVDADGPGLERAHSAVVEELSSGGPFDVSWHVADVTEADWLESIWGARFGAEARLIAAVLCAGVACPGAVDEHDVARWRRALEVNALGVMYSTREAVRLMGSTGGGTIVAIASVAGRLTYVGEPAYVASKHAVVGFCESARRELVGSGIRVALIEPGFVSTPMTTADPAMAQRMAEIEPLAPDDVARAVEFVIEQPARVSITEVMLRPSEQAL